MKNRFENTQMLQKEFNEKYSDLSQFNLADYLADIYNNKEEIDIELMKCIFDLDIDINSKSKDKFTAFMISLLLNNIELTKLFIQKGINVNQTIEIKADYEKYSKSQYFEFGMTFTESFTLHPMSFLVFNYNKEHIKILIDAGIDINAEIYSSIKDLYLGVQSGPISTLLDIAIEKNDIELVKYLLEKKASTSRNIPFTTLFENKYFDMIKILVENDYKKNNCQENNYQENNIRIKIGNSLLELCALVDKEENYDLAKFLIKHGADVNSGSPLMCALNSENGISIAFEKRYNTNHYDVLNTNMIKLLIDNDANVNYVDNNGKSILMSACEAKSVSMNDFENANNIKYEIVQLLIKQGADIHHKDNKKNSVLFYLEDDSSELSTYEDDEDSNIPKKVFFDTHPSEKILKLLLENGANISQRNNVGMTPLMHYALKGEDRLVKILLENGADINAKSEMTAFDLASSDDIKKLIKDTKNNNPQKLVKLLSNFTIDKPIKYTTHTWDFGELKKEYGNFDGYMSAVKKQFENMKSDLEELSPNLYKKIYTFLLETTPDENYSWYSKTDINIGWSSLDGLKQWCDSGENPFNFRLPNPIYYNGEDLTTFEDIINLFKQEIEIRENFKNLKNIFDNQEEKLSTGRKSIFKLDTSTAKLGRQFYTDVEKFSNVIDKIFTDMGTRKESPNITVTTTELEDRSIELKITQHDSNSSRSAEELLERVKEAGDIAQIKESLTNLCDWSVESSYDGDDFRVNFLHSNNVKEIVPLETKPDGFTHVLRFYK